MRKRPWTIVSGRSAVAGFVLLEALLATAIFALGVISLGRCVSNCIAVERLKAENIQAQRILENRVVEIEAGAVLPSPESVESLPPPWTGWKLRQSLAPVEKKNENGQPFGGLKVVRLEVSWRSGVETPSRSLTFYVQPRLH